MANINTGTLIVSRKSAKNILSHLADADNKHLVNRLFNHLDKLNFIEPKELDKLKDNYVKKRNRGVTGYNLYSIELEGKTWLVNTEVINECEEKLYAFSINP